MKIRPLLWKTAIFVIGIGIAASCMADIFMLTDEDGAVSLSNVPVEQGYELLLKAPEENSRPLPSNSPMHITAPSPAGKAMPYRALIDETAKTNKIEAALLHAVITAESGYNPRALSSKGASGLMQLMPETARRYGVADRYDPIANVQGGARYLSDLLKLFDDDIRLTLAAYNAGEHAVARYGKKIPPYVETTRYVDTVMKLYDQYRISLQ